MKKASQLKKTNGDKPSAFKSGSSAKGPQLKESTTKEKQLIKRAKVQENDEDSRFAAISKDSKFRTKAFTDKSNPGGRIVVDERFSAMFTDDEFKGNKSKVDKYGRKLNNQEKGGLSDLSRHYKLSEDDEKRLEALNRIARGEGDDDSDSSSSSEDDDEEDEQEDNVDPKDEMAPVELGEDSTRRLAVVGCDWDHIRALDILAVVQSFTPPTGAILEVAVYSSEFGRKRMALEEVHGPFYRPDGDEEKEVDEINNEDDDEENDLTHEVGNDYNPEKLRKYEKERLLYYVAVITCDSAETAEVLYRECDGLEFEHSSIGLDLRFIPDDVKFSPSWLRDRAEDIPDSYAPLEFVNKSMQQTKVELTWDEPEHDRRKLLQWGDDDLKSKKKDQGIPLEELEAFIASEGEEDSEEEDEKRQKDVERYRSLLSKFSKQTSRDKKVGKVEEAEEEVEDDFFNDGEESDEEEANEDLDVAASKPKRDKRSSLFVKDNQLESKEGKDDEGKSKKSKKNKGKKTRDEPEDSDEEHIELDVKDERFAPLFTEPEFAFDRTDPRFKATTVTKKIEQERSKRMPKGL